MKKYLSVFISALVFAAILCASAVPAQARGGGWGHVHIGGVGFYGGFAPYWYGWPVYAYPAYPYPAPYAYSGYAAPAPASNYWYFCRSSHAYYPYASSCPEGWQQVPTVPPG